MFIIFGKFHGFTRDFQILFDYPMGERKAHQPEMAELRPLNWSDIDEAQPTPGLAVSRESMRAAEEVETTTRLLQED